MGGPKLWDMATKQPANRKPGRPATGKSPKRYFRMDDESWEVILDAAEASEQTISAFIRDALLKSAKRVKK
jgi:hypothetical protein